MQCEPSKTRLIPLSNGLWTLVDAGDFPSLSVHKWQTNRSADKDYVSRSEGYRPKVTYKMHRVILNAPPGVEVDHVNGDGLDNRRSNLRLASRSQNQRNRRLQSSNRSGYKGVSFNVADKKWVANISHQGHQYYLGAFDDPITAAIVRDTAAVRLHGEFAWLNFPKP